MEKDVTIVEMMDDILQVSGPLCHANDSENSLYNEILNFKLWLNYLVNNLIRAFMF